MRPALIAALLLAACSPVIGDPVCEEAGVRACPGVDVAYGVACEIDGELCQGRVSEGSPRIECDAVGVRPVCRRSGEEIGRAVCVTSETYRGLDECP